MTNQKQKKVTFDKVFFAAIGLYVLFVSLLMVSRTIDMWLFIFFVLVSLFSVYALYKIIYKNNTGKLLRFSLATEALLATFLLYPAPLAMVADFIGYECLNLLGEAEKCVDSTTFLSFDPSLFVLMIPMVALAVFSYQKTK